MRGGAYRDSGGDGIYVAGVNGVREYSSNVTLLGVAVDSAWRNGLSVISADGLLVANSTFTNTNGTNPQCGVDLEPDSRWSPDCDPTGCPTMRMESVVLRNLTIAASSRCGLQAGLYGLANSTRPVSVLVEDVLIRGCGFFEGRPLDAAAAGGHASGLYLSNSNLGVRGARGSFRFRGLRVEGTNDAGIEIQSWREGLIDLTFERAALASVAMGAGRTAATTTTPIAIESGSADPTFRSGSLDFGSLRVADGGDRPFLSAVGSSLVGDVRGNFTVLNDPSLRPRGCTASLGPDAAAHGADVQVYACVATNTTATF